MEETLEEQIVRTERELERLKKEKKKKDDKNKELSVYNNKYYKYATTECVHYFYISKAIEYFDAMPYLINAKGLKISESLLLTTSSTNISRGFLAINPSALEEIKKEEFVSKLEEINKELSMYITDEENN